MRYVTALSALVFLAVLALTALTYLATSQWQLGTERLAQQQAVEVVGLVRSTLENDMRGASATVLSLVDNSLVTASPAYDLFHLAVDVFARFPYPESVITWTLRPTGDEMYVLTRQDRSVHWAASEKLSARYPARLEKNPAALFPIVAAMRTVASPDTSATILSLDVAGEPYQIVAKPFFSDTAPTHLSGFAALAINLRWTKTVYLPAVLEQISRITGSVGRISLSIEDLPHDTTTTHLQQPGISAGSTTRTLPLLFVHPRFVSSAVQRHRPLSAVLIRAQPLHNTTQLSAVRGARGAFALAALTGLLAVALLYLTVEAIRSHAALAAMRADFVSSATHDLKTPIALIQLVGDTLAQGRYNSIEAVSKHARLLSQEAERLSESVDSMLAYAKYVRGRPLVDGPMATCRIVDLVEDALERFAPTLLRHDVTLSLVIPDTVPDVLVDRHAIVKVLEIVIDNALKYSTAPRSLDISACVEADFARVIVADRGIGIPPTCLPRVVEMFYRGANVNTRGSGLGLAIASRIMTWHRGRITIRSVLDEGTQVELAIPFLSR